MSNPDTWNTSASTAGNFSFTNSNYTATLTGTTNTGIWAVTGNFTLKYYIEFTCGTVTNTAGNYSIGFNDVSNSAGIFIISTGVVTDSSSGTIGTAAAYTTGNTIGVAIDLTNKLSWWRINNGNWNNSGTAHPETATGGFTHTSASIGVPIFNASDDGGSNTINTGTQLWFGAPPAGFANWFGSQPAVFSGFLEPKQVVFM